MGYIFNYNDSVAYHDWFSSFQQKPVGQYFINLIHKLLKPERHARVLDIGCGSGLILQTLITQKKIHGTGVDPSPYMLDIAKTSLNDKVDLHKAFAEDLPFEDNAFDCSCIINTLGFTENPAKAIEEAARVSRSKLLICIHNRYGTNGFENQCRDRLSPLAWENMTFYSIWEIKHMIKTIIGNVPVQWRSMIYFPPGSGFFSTQIEKMSIFHKIPFGCYTGIVVELQPTYRTRPLIISYSNRDTNKYINAEQLTSTTGNKKLFYHKE
jgi:ubiquinone/menaquinone biosynthesis C-methylase UbiE